jgi:sulfate adenylyltransferase subunit 1 (EFTu-like GTPase family)
VLRPTHDFRGYAGRIISGSIHPGDVVSIWPSGRSSKVARISTWDGDLAVAHAGMSVVLTLEDELDISRGDMITVGHIEMGRKFKADVVWMDERPLDPGRVYVLKQTTRTVTAEVDHGLVLNQIGSLTVSTTRPIMCDRYADNRGTGSFILIDPASNFTAGAGMVVDAVRERSTLVSRPSAAERLARVARAAPTDTEAVEAVRAALEDLLS